MPFTITTHSEEFDAADEVSPSFTPTANSLLVVMLAGFTSDDGDMVASGGSLTYTHRAGILNPASANQGVSSIWTAPVGGSPSSMQVTISGPSGIGDAIYAIYDVTGYDSADPVGLTMTDNNPSSSRSSGTYSGSFGGTTASTSFLIGVAWVGAGSQSPEADSIDTGTGWTQLYNPNNGTDVGHTQYIEAAKANYELDELATNWDFQGWHVSAIEIKAGASGGSLVPPSRPRQRWRNVNGIFRK